MVVDASFDFWFLHISEYVFGVLVCRHFHNECSVVGQSRNGRSVKKTKTSQNENQYIIQIRKNKDRTRKETVKTKKTMKKKKNQ